MSRTRANRYLTFRDVPKRWDDLMRMYPLRPIRDAVDCDNATEIIDLMAGHKLNTDQNDYLDALATLVTAYESEHHEVVVDRVSGLDTLRSLLIDQHMIAADLGRLLGVHRSHAAKILNGERSLTVDHIQKLAERFKVSPELFMP